MFGEDDELEELREIHDFQFSQSNGVVKKIDVVYASQFNVKTAF